MALAHTPLQFRGTRGSLALKPPGVLVYRVYDESGALLYVGMTKDLTRRFAGHHDAIWWSLAAYVRWEVFPDRDQARGEERRLIRTLKPVYNIHGVEDMARRPRNPYEACPMGARARWIDRVTWRGPGIHWYGTKGGNERDCWPYDR